MNMQGPGGRGYEQQWEAQVARTQEHLRMLSIFHYVGGGVLGLISCGSLIHIGLGILFIVNPEIMDEPEVRGSFSDGHFSLEDWPGLLWD